jgi:TPP-dependent 2-oxoacid decarboxylase
MEQTFIQYVLSHLHSLRITDVFGAPDDYTFPINSAIGEDKRFR